MLYCFFRRPTHTPASNVQTIAKIINTTVDQVEFEYCYYIETSSELTVNDVEVLRSLLEETFDPLGLTMVSFLSGKPFVLEVGPQLNFETPWSSAAVEIARACGATSVTKMERSRRYGLPFAPTDQQLETLLPGLFDRMTEMVYDKPLTSLASERLTPPIHWFPVIENGPSALAIAANDLGLSLDQADQEHYFQLFAQKLRRNPNDVEFFGIGQANSEHSRHHVFRGEIFIDDQPMPATKFELVQRAWRENPSVSVIAFGDDSSAIRGMSVRHLAAVRPDGPSPLTPKVRMLHPTATAETHNHPSSVAPYPGAATGTGGRIRDNQAVGRGGRVIASGAAYCTGNLHIPGFEQPWESGDPSHPANLASPLQILIEASNGASDYGNCFGEPLINGHVRTFGMYMPDGSYRSWFKTIMYTMGVGTIQENHINAKEPETGMLIVQIGGPAYRIGMGGSAASSRVSDAATAHLDFDSVQRGNPEMEQRVNRVLVACIEMDNDNPILNAHDYGAGGASNVLTELVYPAGGVIQLRELPLGDTSLSTLEIWGNESQERNAFLIRPESRALLEHICRRENVPMAVVGSITGDGQLVVQDGDNVVVNLPLDALLGKLPPKQIRYQTEQTQLSPLELPKDLTVYEALMRVLQLPSVHSKEFLVHKVDRSVTGQIAQQQCVGPAQLPISDYATVATSLLDNHGTAFAQGEQPIKGLINPAAGVRMALAEALLNLAGSYVGDPEKIRCEANWMAAAKYPGEGARLYRAVEALSEIMVETGVAADGGKDSLSMAVNHPEIGTVAAPLQLVIGTYAFMPNVGTKVTADLKKPGDTLVHIDLSGGHRRLGGTALAQVYGQLGDDCPNVEDSAELVNAFQTMQTLVLQGLVSAVHDVSDGGLVTTLLEMAFAGNVGLDVSISNSPYSAIEDLFSEELGLIVECADVEKVLMMFDDNLRSRCKIIGIVGAQGGDIRITHNGADVLDEAMVDLRHIWRTPSFELEKLQTNPVCVDQELQATRDLVTPPPFHLTFTPEVRPEPSSRPKVAILREQGSNGDREMAASFWAAGFEPWDITTNDLATGQAFLSDFRGAAFVGGFSFGDVLDSARGWAGKIQHHPLLAEQFQAFYERTDTFSLGVCNGAQLLALLGWVPGGSTLRRNQPRFIHNKSGRFESRFVTVEIEPSQAIMLSGMEGSRLGVWVAHGEGYLHVPNPDDIEDAIDAGCVPMHYVNPDGEPTMVYPFNPNGSPVGITALCSADGRHLAMMPHPERLTNQLWQWPWMPAEWESLEASPWLRMFQNAYDWCTASV